MSATSMAASSPPARVSAEGRFYRPELDVLRFAAFLCIFVCHSTYSISLVSSGGLGRHLFLAVRDAGNFGVCMFFFLSSYLITELLRRERIKTAAIHLKSFYMRRILRIWPLYFFTLAVYFLLGKLHPSIAIEPGRVVANLLLVGSWYIAFHPYLTTPLRALWSISVEEQFYLAWPFVAKFGGFRWIAVFSGCLILASLATIGILSSRTTMPVVLWVNSFVQFQFFALGALLALYLGGRTFRISKPGRLLALIAGTACWLAASGRFLIMRLDAVPSPLPMLAGYETAALGTLLIFISVLGVRADFFPAPLVYLGKISYGLYVFHEAGFRIADNLEKIGRRLFVFIHAPYLQTALLIVNKTTALAATILLAALSYRYLESPFLNLKKKFSFVESRSA